jgi:NDP-sugar pyrophosphorylase family protein
MRAMIFAAGLGTRLKPLTDTLPKALVPIAGKPLLEHVILKLKAAGFDEIIVNIHHFPDQIIDFLKANDNFGIRIEVSDERDQLLDTGGGIRKVASFFDDGKPFLVHNVDILSNLDLKELYNQHLRTNSLATLVVSERDTFRYLLFDDNLRLNGWINEKTGETKPAGLSKPELYNKLAFSGIQVLSPQVFDLMKELEPKFTIMDFYLSNAPTQLISGFIPADYKMLDVGKLNVLDEAEKFVQIT